MKIVFLGTSSAVPTKHRDNTAVFFSDNEDCLLVDCPGSVYHKLLKAGVDPTSLKSVFITHTHPDHIYGLPSLIHSLVPSGSFPNIYVPLGTADKVRAFLGLFNLEHKTSLKEVSTNLPVFDCKLFPTCHNKESRGLILKEGKKKIIYTSDTGPLKNTEKIFSRATCLIHDCSAPKRFKKDFPSLDSTHTSAEKLGSIAQKAKAELLVPIHFSGEFQFQQKELRRGIEKFYSGRLFIPRDLDLLEV